LQSLLLPWLGAWASLGPASAVLAAALLWLLATLLLMLAVRVMLGFWAAPGRSALIVLLSLGLTALLLLAWNLGTALMGSLDPLHLHVGLSVLLVALALLAQLWVLSHWLVLPSVRAPSAVGMLGVALLFWVLLIVALTALGLSLGLPVPRP
jgi:hypothetical protein